MGRMSIITLCRWPSSYWCYLLEFLCVEVCCACMLSWKELTDDSGVHFFLRLTLLENSTLVEFSFRNDVGGHWTQNQFDIRL